MRSANRSSGALVLRASSTTCWSRARTDSAATARTSTTSTASPLRVPAVTWLPGPCSTGRGSPVNIDSSTADQPPTTSPSNGIVSPGMTRTHAPTGTASGGTIRSSSPSSGFPVRRAVGGLRATREWRARAARARARASTARPVTRMAMMRGAMAPWSRAANAPLPPRWTWRPPRAIASTALTASAARVPSVISVSMLVAPWRSRRALVRMNGQPPTICTATPSVSTTQPLVGVSGASKATKSAARARGHEAMARHLQPSRSTGCSGVIVCKGTGSAE